MSPAARADARAYVKAYRTTLAVGREQWANYLVAALDELDRLESKATTAREGWYERGGYPD